MSELLSKSTVRFSHITRKLLLDLVLPSFQRKEYANIEIVLTEKKGYGLRAEEDLPKYVLSHSPLCALLTPFRDTFIYEYVGDVVNPISFKKRMREYGQEGIRHFYFMMLQKDEVSMLSV
jgi:hypothetical protein